MLRQRLITAFILIPIVVAILIYLPPPAFLFLTAFIVFIGAWEWGRLMGLKKRLFQFYYLLLMAVMCFTVIFIHVQYVFGLAFIWWLFAFLLVVFYPNRSRWWGNSVVVRGLMGLLVLVPCWAAINFIRNQDNGVYILLFFFVLIWGADSIAYFVGKKWGETKLAPVVSPGKSVEGLGGALLFSVIYALIALWMSGLPIEIWPWGILLSFATVLFSVLGDLFESMLKRQVGVKDSGMLIPGHGGLLDRIDSLTAAAPVFALGGLMIGMYL